MSPIQSNREGETPFQEFSRRLGYVLVDSKEMISENWQPSEEGKEIYLNNLKRLSELAVSLGYLPEDIQELVHDLP